MQFAEGKMGRVFVIRLEEGDLLPAALEQFAEEKRLRTVLCCSWAALAAGR